MRLPEKRSNGSSAPGGWVSQSALASGWSASGGMAIPSAVAVRLPFMIFWCERQGGAYWPWEWTILRVVIGKQEFRVDLALNDWGLGVAMFDTKDWSIHVGPINIECEHGKFYDDDTYMKPAAHLRLFSKPRPPCECELDR